MKYAPKEVEKHLPKANFITVNFRWGWFRRIKVYGFFRAMRIANALTLWLGPIEITVRQRYLIGPARQLHPDAFVRAGREDLL